MTLAAQSVTRLRTRSRQAQAQPGGEWPRDVLEAFSRHPGPYSLNDVTAILGAEPVELLNGWLGRQERTDLFERRVVSNLQSDLDLAAREAGFGQVLG